jgi:acetoin utilization deacetylase AcuC-like enzyme
MLHIAFAPIYRYELPEGHRFPMVKYELIAEQLLYEGIVREAQLFHPQRLEESIALQTHSTSYWDKLTNLTLTKSEERAIGFPINQHFIERGRYI